MQARSPRQPATQRMRLLCGSSHSLVDLGLSSPGTIPGMLCGLGRGGQPASSPGRTRDPPSPQFHAFSFHLHWLSLGALCQQSRSHSLFSCLWSTGFGDWGREGLCIHGGRVIQRGSTTERGPGSTGVGKRHFPTSLFLFLPPSVFLECI